MKVLVTGGVGYIGAHVVRMLAACGHAPIIVDDCRSASPDRAGSFPLERVALEKTAEVVAVFERHRPEGVVHMAGYISVGESVRDPARYWTNNLGAAASLLLACARVPVRTFLFSSTAAVYGNASAEPLREDARLDPTSPYGASKLAFERLLHESGRALGFASSALRYFNAAGASVDWGVGEAHEPEEHLIPRVAGAILDGRKVQVYGRDYPTRDGTCVRDYIHVADLALAHVKVLEAGDSVAGSSLNAGTGRGHTVLEVIRAVGLHLKAEPDVELLPRRAGDPASLVADPSELMRRLDWHPAHSSLDEIVSSAADWELRRRGGP